MDSLDVYMDVILMENLVMNYLILMVTGKFARACRSNMRIFLGSLVGACYVALMILLPGINFYYSTAAKFLLSLLIISISFTPGNLKTFARILIIFYVTTFVFAGASFAFLYLNSNGGFVRNGIVYIFQESKWTSLLLAVLTSVIILRAFREFVQYRLARDKLLKKVGVFFGDKRVDFPALVDTGNSLYDPVTNLPVVVVEFSVLKNILPDEIQEIFSSEHGEDLTRVTSLVTESSWYSRFRLIPFTSLGKENGMLIGFKPDHLEINEDNTKKDIKDVIVGIYNKAPSKNRSYRGLLSPDLL